MGEEQSDMKRASHASRGGQQRAASLSPERRTEIARKGASARWQRSRQDLADRGGDVAAVDLPTATYKGSLMLVNMEVPCYVLNTGARVIGRTSATEMLTGIKGGGDLEKYLGVAALKQFIDLTSVLERMVSFRLPEVEGLDRQVKGLPADVLIEVAQGFVSALHASQSEDADRVKLTSRQREMAINASMFLAACAKVGLDALIDEATGYQYDRKQDALAVKLQAYLEDEMRKWEKTFPDELWREFARLTGWTGPIYSRPKYWGKLVNELIYEYLDQDVARWLKENAPEPRHGQNYHQWLSGQFGLKKLVEHIWMVVGIAKTCKDIIELKDRVAQLNGRVPVQVRVYLPPPSKEGNEHTLFGAGSSEGS